ncbi:MAG: hypothetical protein IPI67_22445 [Myxococcales bacterium]|nr:hypothetical protein [Myxococcales bacterium]
MRLTRTILACALGLCLTSSVASAGEVATKAAADALFRQAVTLADGGDFRASVEKFRASYELDPARGTLQGWAMAEERLDRVLDAYARFQRLLEVSVKAGDETRASFARERLRILVGRVPTLVIDLGGDVPKGTKLTLDDDPLPAGVAGTPLPISPGQHRIAAVAPDGRKFSRMLAVPEGARAHLRVTWITTPRPADPEPQRAAADEGAPSKSKSVLPTAGLVLGAVGVVAAGVGSYLWFDAGSDFSTLEQRCPDKKCAAEEQDRIDRAKRKETWSQVLVIGGALAVAGGVTLYVLGSRERTGAQAVVKATPGGLVVSGRF